MNKYNVVIIDGDEPHHRLGKITMPELPPIGTLFVFSYVIPVFETKTFRVEGISYSIYNTQTDSITIFLKPERNE